MAVGAAKEEFEWLHDQLKADVVLRRGTDARENEISYVNKFLRIAVQVSVLERHRDIASDLPSRIIFFFRVLDGCTFAPD